MASTLKIIQDVDPMSPRDFDNLGTLACWHDRYTLGDEQPTEHPTDWCEELPAGDVALPVYLYDHSGLTISTTPFSCRWDSGQLGWIYVTAESIRKEFGVQRISAKLRERVRQILENEVRLYDQYLRGQVWGYVIEDDAGDTVDSCFGFLGDDLDETGMRDAIDTEYHDELRDAWDARG